MSSASLLEPRVLSPLPDRWDDGVAIGNGLLGALVWRDGDELRLSLDRTDLWDMREIPEYHSAEYSYAQMRRWVQQGRRDELLRLFDAPYERAAPTRIPAGRIGLRLGGAKLDRAALALDRALATVSGGDCRLETFVHARDRVGVARVRGARTMFVRLAAPAYGGPGALARLGYDPARVVDGPSDQSFCQVGHGGFRYAVHVGWRAHGEGEWLLAWSIATSSDGADPATAARQRVDAALARGFDRLLEDHAAWWATYWSQSSLELPNEKLTRAWYDEQHRFAACSRRGAPPIALQGPWTADDGGLPPWKGDYHHDLNTQLSYWPCYAANHLEEGLAFLDWLWSTRPACRAWTKRFFGLPGLNVPMTADLRNEQIGGWFPYTHSLTVSAWLAHHFWLHARFSADRTFVRERAYPYLADVATFLEAATAERDAHGKRTIPLSSSPEIHDNKLEAFFPSVTNYDLGLARWLFGAAAELARELRLRDDEARWQRVLAELPALATGREGQLLIAAGHPLPESHRHHSQLMAFHPLGLLDPLARAEDARVVRASLAEVERHGTKHWTGYSFAWWAGMRARSGDGVGAERALDTFYGAFVTRNGFHCNGDQSGTGISKITGRDFTLEGNFAAASATQDMLLQSQGGVVRVFPALPAQSGEARFDRLRAEGAFLVSARRDGRRWSFELEAERGGTAHVVAPDGSRIAFTDLRPGERRTREGRSTEEAGQ